MFYPGDFDDDEDEDCTLYFDVLCFYYKPPEVRQYLVVYKVDKHINDRGSQVF